LIASGICDSLGIERKRVRKMKKKAVQTYHGAVKNEKGKFAPAGKEPRVTAMIGVRVEKSIKELYDQIPNANEKIKELVIEWIKNHEQQA
jgi:putative protein kinase ArgK-like GTPase of G3E family